jgi:type II secretory pathway component PulF
VAVLLASALSLWHAIHPMRAGMLVPRAGRDRAFWWLPILHGLERDRGLADAFDLLDEALAIATPIDRAFAEAAGLRVNVVLRRRLERWAVAVASGMSLGDGARVASMPPLVTGMLTNVSATASAADVFGFLARYYRTRFSRTAALIEGAMVPVVVLIFGFFVACVALAMFMPLITLIQNLSATSAGWRL